MTKTLVTAGQSVIVQNLGVFLPSIFFRTYVNQMSVVQKLRIKKFITEDFLQNIYTFKVTTIYKHIYKHTNNGLFKMPSKKCAWFAECWNHFVK